MRMYSIIAIAVMLALAGCSHNAALLTVGKQLKVGSSEYAEITYLNGFAIIDMSRENSSWAIEIDDEVGLSYDNTTGTVKGIKRIERHIGRQITGYLVDLAKANPEAAKTYLSTESPENTQK